MKFAIFNGKPTEEQIKAFDSGFQTAQEKFLSAMAEYYREKMERDDRKKVCSIIYHEGCFDNLPPHHVLLCSPKLAFTNVKNFPESVLREFGDLDDELRIRIHFLGKVDGDMFHAHVGFSRRDSSALVCEEEVPEDRLYFPHVLMTITVPVKDLLELGETMIRDLAREKCVKNA